MQNPGKSKPPRRVSNQLKTSVMQDRPYLASSVIKNLQLIQTVRLQNVVITEKADPLFLLKDYAYIYVCPDFQSELFGFRYFYVRYQFRIWQRGTIYSCQKLINALDAKLATV